MKKLSNTEGELKKSVVYQKDMYFVMTMVCGTAKGGD